MMDVLRDLADEQGSLDELLSGLAAQTWDRQSPAEGWSLRDCVAHLAESEEIAALAVANRCGPEPPQRPDGSVLTRRQLEAREMKPDDVRNWWIRACAQLRKLLAQLDPDDRIPWAVGTMSARSFAIARLMETWSHGLDIYGAAGLKPKDTDRLHLVAELGWRTRDFAYRNRGLPSPATSLRVELDAPSGALWKFGPNDAEDVITGPAGDFCRVVVRRIHWLDTSLTARGRHAEEFLEVAQAYAGPPGNRPAAKGRRR